MAQVIKKGLIVDAADTVHTGTADYYIIELSDTGFLTKLVALEARNGQAEHENAVDRQHLYEASLWFYDLFSHRLDDDHLFNFTNPCMKTVLGCSSVHIHSLTKIENPVPNVVLFENAFDFVYEVPMYASMRSGRSCSCAKEESIAKKVKITKE
jgi:hypothetical protein